MRPSIASTADAADYHDGEFFYRENIVELDPTLTDLIDHPRHVGLAYDIYGELLKLHQTQLFIRTPQEKPQQQNGIPMAREPCPMVSSRKRYPCRSRSVTGWTDLPQDQMGNLVVVLPGSHRNQYQDAYDTHDSLPGELILKPRRGAMTIMHSSIWHRVEPNFSKVTRKNFFIAYCPSWLTAADRVTSDPDWLATINR